MKAWVYWHSGIVAATLRSMFETKSFKPIFCCAVFLIRNTVDPSGIYLWNKPVKSPQALFFSWFPFQILNWMLSPKKGGGSWYCVCFFSIYFTHIRRSILKLILYLHNRIFRLYKSLKATYTLSHKIKLTCLTGNKIEN